MEAKDALLVCRIFFSEKHVENFDLAERTIVCAFALFSPLEMDRFRRRRFI